VTGENRSLGYSPSNSQPLAALGPACVEYLAAIAGGHASPEPVGTDALDFAGLIRSFHELPLLVRLAIRKGRGS